MHERFERFQQVVASAENGFTKSPPPTVTPRPSHDDNQPAERAPLPKIIKADIRAASLDSETLAEMVRDGLAEFRPKLEKWLPLAIELHSRFETLKAEKPGTTILRCSTWAQFCTEILNYSNRHMRRLMEGTNPAVKYRNKGQRRGGTKPLASSIPAAQLERNTDWTDDDYVKTCVRLVESTLRPLESDPPRFHRVALAIAREIAGDFLNDAESASVEPALATLKPRLLPVKSG
jgi:hypothetical protein